MFFGGRSGMLFWGTILSSTLSAGPSTESEVKRHKVLSTSKSLALFCSGLVILLANEASEAIRHEYRVPGAVLARRRCSAPRLRARTAAAASSQAAGGARCRRGSSSVAGGARCRRGSSNVAGGPRCRRRSYGVAHSFSDVRQTASVSTTEAAAYISAAAAGAHT